MLRSEVVVTRAILRREEETKNFRNSGPSADDAEDAKGRVGSLQFLKFLRKETVHGEEGETPTGVGQQLLL